MNKGGLVFFYTLMLGVLVIVLALALASPTKFFIDSARNDTNCSAPATDYDQGACIALDIMKPMIIGGTILVGIAILAARQWLSR